MMTPEQVAEAIVKAVTKKSPLVILSTKGKALFWLNKLFPKWVERQIYTSMKKEPHAPFR
jgi:short-subunit dehydrogenase